MRVLVFSDSHGNVEAMESAIRRYPADLIVHLGDNVRDAMHLQGLSAAPVEYVRGNCDIGYGNAPLKLQLNLDGKRILLTHGHEYQVKRGRDLLRAELERLNVDIILYGHTHIALAEHIGGKLILNPGAVCGGWGGKAEAALLHWEPDGAIDIKKLEL